MKTLETLCIRITKHCNISCTHCRAGSSPFSKEYLNNQEMMNSFRELMKLGLKHVSISGGEPLIVKNIGSLCQEILQLGINVTITTNGTIPLSKTDLVKNVPAAGNIRFRISIDGDKELHERIRGKNTFIKAINTLYEIKSIYRWVAINTVVFESTLRTFGRLLGQLDLSKVDEWALISPVAKGNAKNMIFLEEKYPSLLNEMEKKLRDHKFKGRVKKWDFLNHPNASVLIKSNGSIVLSGVSEYDDIVLGNIKSGIDSENLRKKIDQRSDALEKAYFTWSKWA